MSQESEIRQVVSSAITGLRQNYPLTVKGVSFLDPGEAAEIETAIFKELLSQAFYQILKMDGVEFAQVIVEMMINKYVPISESNAAMAENIKDSLVHFDTSAVVLSLKECAEGDCPTYSVRLTDYKPNPDAKYHARLSGPNFNEDTKLALVTKHLFTEALKQLNQ